MLEVILLMESIVYLLNLIFPKDVILFYLSIALFFLFIIIMCKERIEMVSLNILIIFLTFLQIVGVFIIETTKIYLNEIAQWSFFKGSLLEIIIITTFFWYFLIKKRRYFNLNIEKKKKKCDKLIIYILLIYSFYFFFKVLLKPYYIVNVDRFMYKKLYFNSVENILFNLNGGIILYLTTNIFIKKNKKIYIILLIINLLFIFMSGGKFGDFLFPLGLAYLYVIPEYFNRNKKIYKLILRFISGVILILSITFFHALFLNKTNFITSVKNFYIYFLQRGAQEGQLWWSTYEKKYKGTLNEFFNEFIPQNSSNYYDSNKKLVDQKGILKVMLLSTPEKIIKKKFEMGSRYSSSTNASLNYYFGVIGNIIYLFLISKLLKLFYNIFYKKIKNELLNFLNLLLLMKFYMKIHELISMSAFSIIFYWKTIIVVLGLIIIRKIDKLIK